MINAEALVTNNITKPITDMEGVTVIDGWVKVYLEDLKRNNKKGTVVTPATKDKFPVIAIHISEDTFSKWSLEKFMVVRQVTISGAVDLKSKTDIDVRLQKLYRSVISAIVTSLDPVKDVNKITFNNARFSIPDDDSDYAMFELIITTKTNEDISTWN